MTKWQLCLHLFKRLKLSAIKIVYFDNHDMSRSMRKGYTSKLLIRSSIPKTIQRSIRAIQRSIRAIQRAIKTIKRSIKAIHSFYLVNRFYIACNCLHFLLIADCNSLFLKFLCQLLQKVFSLSLPGVSFRFLSGMFYCFFRKETNTKTNLS